jgi:hypothetical protein
MPTQKSPQPPDRGSDDRRLYDVTHRKELDPHSLVGSYFHTYNSDEDRNVHRDLHYQGCVVAEPAPGVYLVELFSFMHGASTGQRLCRLEDMTNWEFFDTAPWMNNVYEHDVGPRMERDEARKERALRQTLDEGSAMSPTNGS